MKKKITLTVLGIFVSCFSVYFYIKYQANSQYEKSIQTFPNVMISDYALNPESIYTEGSINLYAFFNSECVFCLDEVEDIVDNMEGFEDVNIFLISDESEDVLKNYANDSEFLGIPNFTILIDKENKFSEFFKAKVTPSTFAYTKDGILIGYNFGFQSVDKLKSMLFEN